jgi:hypothetical protein
MPQKEQFKLKDIIRSIHAIEEDLMVYERKYGLLSETFYSGYSQGEEPEDDTWVLDWAGWAGAYQSWLALKDRYQQMIQQFQQDTPHLTGLVRALA